MMNSATPPKLGLPALVFTTGFLLSLLFYFVFADAVHRYFELWVEYIDALPWATLILGSALSLFAAIITRILQVTRHRANRLNQMNLDLKKEIIERIQLEESKQKLEIALLQGQKLQSIGTLASGIAHDFNNLLYAIIGYAEMTRDDVEKDSLAYQNLGKILEASRRGQDLIFRLSAFSRRQTHQFEVLVLENTIEAALALLRPTIPASVQIQFHAEQQTKILGNQTQLHQVLVNLINNAVDAMNGEGIINLHIEHLASNHPYLQNFPNTLPEKYCKLTISDNGLGMDQVTMERIFEPFFTTKEVGKGTGLGLSIVHSIMKEHAGEITVESHLGVGTRFVLLLPEYHAKGRSQHGENFTS